MEFIQISEEVSVKQYRWRKLASLVAFGKVVKISLTNAYKHIENGQNCCLATFCNFQYLYKVMFLEVADKTEAKGNIYLDRQVVRSMYGIESRV